MPARVARVAGDGDNASQTQVAADPIDQPGIETAEVDERGRFAAAVDGDNRVGPGDKGECLIVIEPVAGEMQVAIVAVLAADEAVEVVFRAGDLRRYLGRVRLDLPAVRGDDGDSASPVAAIDGERALSGGERGEVSVSVHGRIGA